MLTNLFLNVFQTSIYASIAILILLFIRKIIYKMPKTIMYRLWAIILFRLFFSVNFYSLIVDFLHRYTNLNESINITKFPNAIPNIGINVTKVINDNFVSLGSRSANEKINLLLIISIIWIIGIIFTLAWNLVEYYKLRRSLSDSVLLKQNIYLNNNLFTPIILGIINPNIYIPANISDGEKEFIILHEQIHIKRKDNILKFAAFIGLCIHWFNPLVWIAFNKFESDMEMSCDELVVEKFGYNIKNDYIQSLLNYSNINDKESLVLGFGSTNFKDRIINILNFKEKSRKEKNMYRAVFALIMISLLLISGKFIPGQTNKVPSNNNIKPLTSYPKDYSVEEALADNMVVSIHGDLQGDSKATLKIFLLQVNKKQESLINIYTVTIEGDPILTRILFKDKKFLIEYDNSRDYYRDPNSSEMVVATRNFIRLIDDGTTSYLVGINDDNISDQEILKSLEKENNIIWLLSYFK